VTANVRRLVALACLGVHVAASADDLQEVVVTARKRAESLASVPLVVDVVRGDELRPGSVDGLQSLAARLPGLSFEALWGGTGSAPVLRGQSQPSTAGDNVGVFVDGVYQANRSAVDLDALDVERVEVIRGPQSAMFGRSTFAGAIHFVPREPAAAAELSARVDAGTDDLVAGTVAVSGPVGDRGLRGRLAAGHRESDGTSRSLAGEPLGGLRRDAVAATLAFDDPNGAFAVRLHARAWETRMQHPAMTTLAGADYDCGAIDPVSRQWSYRCGRLPVGSTYDVSPRLPDSRGDGAQAALHVDVALGATRLASDTSWYSADVRSYRDFAGNGALPLGVCRDRNCVPLPGTLRLVERIVRIDVVQAPRARAEEWAQELRLSGDEPSWNWMVGVAAALTRLGDEVAFGADARQLGPGEQYTAPLPAAPALAGPLSQVNRALVADPGAEQRLQSRVLTERRSYAAFGAIEGAPTARLRLRAEARVQREREQLDGVWANYAPSFGRAIGPQHFTDVTPRFSAELAVSERWRGWLSAAKGSRSGGTNAVPGLDPDEQHYEPEWNWTEELGLRYASAGPLRSFGATVYYVDWRNTQILGFATTPGVGNLITRNTAGITTRGIELQADVALARWLAASAAFSHADPSFRAGSDDPGSRGFCGITATNSTSTFCTVGPSRGGGTQVVPYVDGNVPNRAARRSWNLQLVAAREAGGHGWDLRLATELAGQDDVYERPVNGAEYGARTLLGLRASASRGPWTVELWGTNLADRHYARAAAARAPLYYPTSPRPLDLVVADGRRIGLGVRYATARR
jgi:iron complex outermembrane receptor protein